MRKEYIDEKEFNELNDLTKYSRPGVDGDTLAGVYDYLKYKRVYKENEIIENPERVFLLSTFHRVLGSPRRIDAADRFLKSDYLSNILKGEFLNITDRNPGYDNLNMLLKSNTHINDFAYVDLLLIRKALDTLKDEKRYGYDLLPQIFEEYMFALDGTGPIEYIRNRYSETRLAKDILAYSGVVPYAMYYDVEDKEFNYLNEDHLLSIYEKYEKYLPDNSKKFIEFVDKVNPLNAYNFVKSYSSFIGNNFSCDEINPSSRVDEKSDYIRYLFLDKVKKVDKSLKLRK